MPKTALVVGATGLIGEQLVKLIANSGNYHQITVISRREITIESEMVQVEIVDFDHLDSDANYWNVEDVFCCLGTTMKKAGSKEAFRKVDFMYPLKVAECARARGANSFHLVSALGADSSSSVFYNKVKGEVEQAIKNLNYNQFHIYQPSLLFGDRKEFRMGERLGIFLFRGLNFLMVGSLQKYRGIDSGKVAKAMLANAQSSNTGVFFHTSDELQNY